MKHFYVTLPSNSSKDYYGIQSLTHYRTRLAKSIDLNVNEWEVGLAEIVYPITWNNIYDATFRVRKIVENKWEWIEGSIPDGHYRDVNAVVQSLQKYIDGILDDQKHNVYLVYLENSQRVKIFTGEEYGLILSSNLSQPLGFGDKSECEISNMIGNEDGMCDMKRLDGETVTSPFVADVNRGLRSLFVHCDIIDPQLVGHQSVPLLRTIAVKGQVGEVVAESFSNIHYMGVQRSTFQEIEVLITDDTGKIITFNQGRVIVKLHFKRK